jgi:hypothetical protein
LLQPARESRFWFILQQEHAGRERGHDDVGDRIQRAERSFLEGPVGQARAAKGAGQRWFQVELPPVEATRTLDSMLFGDVVTRNRNGSGQGALLSAIEREGWELFQAGFVHDPATARDSGTVGVYLFRATSDGLRTDEPWIDAVLDALHHDA